MTVGGLVMVDVDVMVTVGGEGGGGAGGGSCSAYCRRGWRADRHLGGMNRRKHDGDGESYQWSSLQEGQMISRMGSHRHQSTRDVERGLLCSFHRSHLPHAIVSCHRIRGDATGAGYGAGTVTIIVLCR